MAMIILAGNQSRINAFLNAVSVISMVLPWCYNIPLKVLRQEFMAEINGFYHFNGVLMAN